MHNDAITLFNRKVSRDGDVWYPTVIENVNLNIDRAAVLAKYGAEAQDKAVLHVCYRDVGGQKVVAEKSWKPPKEWNSLADPATAITFADGDRFDFFWLGKWEGSAPIQDVDYVADTDFYTYMNRMHDHVFAITSVGGPYSVIPHFEIAGK